MGLKARAKEGKWNGGRTPYGYKYNSKGKVGIIEDEIKIVGLIIQNSAIFSIWLKLEVNQKPYILIDNI